MVTISRNVQFGHEDKTQCLRLLKAVKKHKSGISPIYCITCAEPRLGLAEVEPLHTIALEAGSRDIFVVGIAEGRDAALELLQKIMLQVYTETGDFDVRAVYTE